MAKTARETRNGKDASGSEASKRVFAQVVTDESGRTARRRNARTSMLAARVAFVSLRIFIAAINVGCAINVGRLFHL
jgi:hypothetical protein